MKMNENNMPVTNNISPGNVITIDPDKCIGCNSCVNICRSDVLFPSTAVIDEKTNLYKATGKPPILVYPDECWFCGCCIGQCPVKGAIKINIPLCQKPTWKRKDSGEIFRLGMSNPPAPNPCPPVGGWEQYR